MHEPKVTLDEAKTIVEKKMYPSVTENNIKEKIKQVSYNYHKHLTICVIEMLNGFFVVGKAAPADRRNFDPYVGQRYAFEDAFRQLWQLEGYLLRDQLHEREVDAGVV